MRLYIFNYLLKDITMKKYNVFLVFACLVNLSFAMQRGARTHDAQAVAQFVYRFAQISDIPQLLDAIEAAEHTPDAENIVILPRKFRERALRSAIEQNRLFVACDAVGNLMGFKKLFVLTGKERDDVLNDEIRCTKPGCQGAPAHIIDETRCYVYTGADFTLPDFRGQGVNKALMEYALSTLHVTEEKMVFVFGVTEHSVEIKRQESILKAVQKFLGEHRRQESYLEVAFYPAEKPTFETDAQECVPLEHGVPGYGYVLEER